MDQLPTEIISHVMSFLYYYDHARASMVCKKWYQASLDPALKRDLDMQIIVLPNGQCASPVEGLRQQPISILHTQFITNAPEQLRRPRITPMFVMTNHCFTSHVEKAPTISTCFGIHFKVLDVTNFGSFSLDAFFEFTGKACRNLRLLIINPDQIQLIMNERRQEEFRATFHLLVGIEVPGSLTGCQIKSLLEALPNLEHCWISGGMRVGDGSLGAIGASLLEDLLRRYPGVLCISKMYTTIGEFLRIGSSIKLMQVEELHLSDTLCEDERARDFLSVIRTRRLYPNLRGMSVIVNDPEKMYQRVVSASRSLETLQIRLGSNIRNKCLECLCDLPNVSAVYLFTRRCLLKIEFQRTPGMRLKELVICHDDFRVALSEQAEPFTINAAIAVLRLSHLELRTFVVQYPRMPQPVFESIINTFGELTELVVHGDKWRNNVDTEPSIPSINHKEDAGKMSKLISLSLNGSTTLNIDSILSMSFPVLQKLQLRSCHNLTYVGLRALAQSAYDLRVLDITACCQVTDAGFSVVVASLKRLREISIEGCTSLTIECLRSIIDHKPPLLRFHIDYKLVHVASEYVELLISVIPSCQVSGCNWSFHPFDFK